MADKSQNIIELKHISKIYDDNGFKAVDGYIEASCQQKTY